MGNKGLIKEIIIVGLLLIWCLTGAVTEIGCKVLGAKTDATITKLYSDRSITRRWVSNGEIRKVQYEFMTADGSQALGKHRIDSSFEDDLQPGETVEIKYLTFSPDVSCLSELKYSNNILVYLIFFFMTIYVLIWAGKDAAEAFKRHFGYVRGKKKNEPEIEPTLIRRKKRK